MNRPCSTDRCAYLGRVSTPRQKIEHQRESVLRFAEVGRIRLPPVLWFEDHVRRHKMLDEGERFQDLMKLVRARKLDWIIVATFDRWGIRNKNEIFVVIEELRKYDCKLWSVADELDITGTDDASFWRVAARAEAATAYVSQQADKNIQKMVLMAEQGWATTGNNPFGLDLVCYPLDRSRPLFRVVRMRYKSPHLYRIIHFDPKGKFVREETSTAMPPRDKKATGYRYAHSVEKGRIKAVQLMFQLFAEGMDEAQISEHLWKLGYKHYDKPFGYHGVQSILQNPAYIGRPMFGKNGVGQYKIVHDRQPKKAERKSTDPFVIKKPKVQWVGPSAPLDDLPPVIDPALFERVQARFDERARTSPAYGKRRSRDRVAHPLNGKVICPDCGKPMVRGSSAPQHKKAKLFFVCGTYRRTIRKECFANSVSWDVLDQATEELLKAVGDRIDGVTTGKPELADEEWLLGSELGVIVQQVLLRKRKLSGLYYDPKKGVGSALDCYEAAFAEYDKGFSKRTAPLRKELAEIEDELANVAVALPAQISRPTIYQRLTERADELERKKAEIEPQLVPLTDKARAILNELASIKATIEGADKAKKASLLDSFVEAVVPVFDVKTVGKKKSRRVEVVGFRFVPKAGNSVLSTEMKVVVARTGRDSSRPPAGSWPGMSSMPGPARS
jgi:hypothetical protein